MKRGTPDHPKVYELCRRLDIGKAMAVGMLELLWHFTAQYAPTGDIGKFSDEAIAAAVDWSGDPGSLIEALVAARWLDRSDDHRLVVHDWHEHADYAVARKLKKSGLTFVTIRDRKTEASGGPFGATEQGGAHEAVSDRANARTCAQETSSDRATPVHRSNTERPSVAQDSSSDRARNVLRSRLPEPVPEPEPVPVPEPAARASPRAGGTAGLPAWLAAIETTLRDAVGRPPRPDTALKLATSAAGLGIHPRYVVRWIAERHGSPPKSDGLYVRLINTDLPAWVKRQPYDPSWLPVEQAQCSQCGGVITAFRDAIVPCKCFTANNFSDLEPIAMAAEAVQ